MSEYEVTWSMYGTARVEASSAEEAGSIASRELIHWNGFGVDLADVSVDGSEAEGQP